MIVNYDPKSFIVQATGLSLQLAESFFTYFSIFGAGIRTIDHGMLSQVLYHRAASPEYFKIVIL
jgi:hypothetical protein